MIGIASSNTKSITSQTLNEKSGSKEELYPCNGLCTLEPRSHRLSDKHAVHVAVIVDAPSHSGDHDQYQSSLSCPNTVE